MTSTEFDHHSQPRLSVSESDHDSVHTVLVSAGPSVVTVAGRNPPEGGGTVA
jgi:hypothetical protein